MVTYIVAAFNWITESFIILKNLYAKHFRFYRKYKWIRILKFFWRRLLYIILIMISSNTFRNPCSSVG